MRVRFILVCVAPLLVAGCGAVNTSPLNPFNWFGGREDPQAVSPLEQPADPRPLIDQVTQVTIDSTPAGAIVRASGLAAAVGYWNAALVPVNRDGEADASGVLTLEFRAVPPPEPTPGSPAARTVVTGYFVSRQRLQDVRVITVTAATNSASVRR